MSASPASSAQPLPGAGHLRQRLMDRVRPIVIGVAGDSGSGKTTYTRGIEWLLGESLVSQISLDGYHREDRATRRRTGSSPLDPDQNRLDEAASHLRQLINGDPVLVPVYDHATGCFGEPRWHQPTPVILVEGLHTLYPVMRDLLDFAIYVDTDATIRRDWKTTRDTRGRGYRSEDVEAEIQRRATQYDQWIAGQQDTADVILRIHPSRLASLALGEMNPDEGGSCHHLEVIVHPQADDQPALYCPVDLNNMNRASAVPFMLATVPSRFRGRAVNVLHVDGQMPSAALATLEQEICAFAGVEAPSGDACASADPQPTIRFAQMLVAWPILAQVAALESA